MATGAISRSVNWRYRPRRDRRDGPLCRIEPPLPIINLPGPQRATASLSSFCSWQHFKIGSRARFHFLSIGCVRAKHAVNTNILPVDRQPVLLRHARGLRGADVYLDAAVGIELEAGVLADPRWPSSTARCSARSPLMWSSKWQFEATLRESGQNFSRSGKRLNTSDVLVTRTGYAPGYPPGMWIEGMQEGKCVFRFAASIARSTIASIYWGCWVIRLGYLCAAPTSPLRA